MRLPLFGLGIGLLLFSLACGDGKKGTQRSSEVLRGGSTVYGDKSQGSTSENTSSEELIQEDPSSYTEYSLDAEVDANEMDLAGSRDASLDNLNWEPVYFDFDQDQVTEAARAKLKEYARVLQSRPNLRVLLEGHCDHRGTEDYNLALGERRAQAVKRYFLELGVPTGQMRTISYGELRPISKDSNESAWARNRRVSFAF